MYAIQVVTKLWQSNSIALKPTKNKNRENNMRSVLLTESLMCLFSLHIATTLLKYGPIDMPKVRGHLLCHVYGLD